MLSPLSTIDMFGLSVQFYPELSLGHLCYYAAVRL